MENSEIIIRRAKFEDLERICEILSEGFGDTPQAMRYWWRIMENKQIHTMVAEEKGTLIGTATLHVLEKLLHGGSFVGLIEDVAVTKTNGGKGVGKLLIDGLIEVAEERRCYKVILNCDKKIKKFYEKCGMTESGIQMRIDLK